MTVAVQVAERLREPGAPLGVGGAVRHGPDRRRPLREQDVRARPDRGVRGVAQHHLGALQAGDVPRLRRRRRGDGVRRRHVRQRGVRDVARADILLTEGASTIGAVANSAAYTEGGPWLAEALGYLDGNRHSLRQALDELAPLVGYRAPDGTYLAWWVRRAASTGEPVHDRARGARPEPPDSQEDPCVAFPPGVVDALFHLVRQVV